jgi:4-hydroxybenzoate polyprenyltransferase
MLKAWRTYLAERFPVPVTLMLAFATASASYVVGDGPVFGAGNGTVVFDVLGFLADVALMFLLLFHLRVFDEHKDFAQDAATRPDRPVQRGLITLGQLKVAGAVAIAIEVALAISAGTRGLWWALPLGYSVLMLFEFGAPRWLERHYPIYAISHSAITSMVCIALALRFPWRGYAWGLELPALALLALASTFSIDVLRKTWAPESEIAGVDSWSQMVGVRKATVLGALLIGIAGACAAWLGWRFGGRGVWLAVIGALTGWGIWTILRFAAAPTKKGEKMLQTVAGIHYLVAWTGIAIVAIAEHGISFV